MSAITTHVLDTARGRPAANILVVLERATADAPPHFQELGRGATDADGRLRTLLSPDAHLLSTGTYRITFHTGAGTSSEHEASTRSLPGGQRPSSLDRRT